MIHLSLKRSDGCQILRAVWSRGLAPPWLMVCRAGEWKYWLKIVRGGSIRFAIPGKSEDVKAYLDSALKTCLPKLEKKGAPAWKINEINNFHAHAVRQIDHVGRRLLKGETIPQDEKVFSILTAHAVDLKRQGRLPGGTRWSALWNLLSSASFCITKLCGRAVTSAVAGKVS